MTGSTAQPMALSMPAERIPPGAAARILGISRKTLLKYARAGKMPGAVEIVDAVWRFDETALRRWLRQKEAEACPIISTGVKASGISDARLENANIDAAYARLLGLKR